MISLLNCHFGDRFVIWSDSVICSYAMQGTRRSSQEKKWNKCDILLKGKMR